MLREKKFRDLLNYHYIATSFFKQNLLSFENINQQYGEGECLMINFANTV